MLWFDFEFRGGGDKFESTITEKFLAFMVIGGNEIPIYQLLREGLMEQTDPFHYRSHYDTLKLFMLRQDTRFGRASKQFYSFYVQLLKDEDTPVVTIKTFSHDKVGWYLKGPFHFLKKAEVLSLLAPESTSRKFLGRQSILPKKLLRELIIVDRSVLQREIRHIRIGQNK